MHLTNIENGSIIKKCLKKEVCTWFQLNNPKKQEKHMQTLYRNLLEIPAGGSEEVGYIGKIIWCEEFTEDLTCIHTVLGLLVPEHRSPEERDQLKRAIMRRQEELKGNFPQHESIKREPQQKVVGGAWIFIRGKTAFLMGSSGKYGPIDDSIAKQCLVEYEVERIPHYFA